MPNPIRITADVSKAKRSILDIGKTISNVGSKSKTNPISIFTKQEQDFIKTGLKDLVGTFEKSRIAISKLITEHSRLIQGTKEEKKAREAITEELEKQVKLGKQIASGGGSVGGGGGPTKGTGVLSSISGLFKGGGDITKAVGIAVKLAGLTQLIASTYRYRESVGDRIRLQGLGVSPKLQRRGFNPNLVDANGQPISESEQNISSAKELARIGLTEATSIAAQTETTAIGGRKAGSLDSVIQRAGIERAYGLEKGQLGGIMGSLSPLMGGAAANDTTLKAMASLISGGVGDALGPTLDSMVDLLTTANDQGLSQINAMVGLFAASTQSGGRTPAQIARIFGGIDRAIKGSQGEQNAFFQNALANAGIGGGTVGGTQLAISSGGVFGLDKERLRKRNFGENQIKAFEELGLFKGFGERSQAMLAEGKRSAGINPETKLSSITDKAKLVGLNSFFNSMFGTSGTGGLESANALEQAKINKTPQKTLEKILDDIKSKNESTSEKRLATINSSLSGILDDTSSIEKTLSSRLGETGGKILNRLIQAQTVAITAETIVVSGVVKAAGDAEDSIKGKKAFNTSISGIEGSILNSIKSTYVLGDKVLTNIAEAGRRQLNKPGDASTMGGIEGNMVNSAKSTYVLGDKVLTDILNALREVLGVGTQTYHPKPIAPPVSTNGGR